MTDVEKVQKNWKQLRKVENQTEEICKVAVERNEKAAVYIWDYELWEASGGRRQSKKLLWKELLIFFFVLLGALVIDYLCCTYLGIYAGSMNEDITIVNIWCDTFILLRIPCNVVCYDFPQLGAFIVALRAIHWRIKELRLIYYQKQLRVVCFSLGLTFCICCLAIAYSILGVWVSYFKGIEIVGSVHALQLAIICNKVSCLLCQVLGSVGFAYVGIALIRILLRKIIKDKPEERRQMTEAGEKRKMAENTAILFLRIVVACMITQTVVLFVLQQ